MNGIHEVTGSTPVWSITPSLRSAVLDHPLLGGAQQLACGSLLAGPTPVWSTSLRSRASQAEA